MQLTAILLTICSLTVTARSVSQSITFSGNDVELEKIFAIVKQQTGHFIFYQEELLTNAKPVTINAVGMPLTEFMNKIMEGQPLSYSIKNTSIIIKSKSTATGLSPRLFSPPPLTGRIMDAEGNPVSGVSVIIKGTKTGTITDANGNFTLYTEPGQTLVISSVEFEKKEIKISKETNIVIALHRAISSLNEVVVNKGYYSTTQRLNTGSVSKVSGEKIHLHPIVNPLQSLQGRIAGVFVEQTTGVPGGAFNIRIRGMNSMANGNDPLYIIDGVPFGAAQISLFNASDNIVPNPNPLNLLNPADIESIEILKDADATAIYGSRGANGVVLITTVKGRQGKSQLNLNITQGFAQNTNKTKMLNTEQYLEMRREAFVNDGTSPAVRDYDINGTWDQSRYTDWKEVLTDGTASISNYQASFSGGTVNTQFLVNGGYYRETTVFPGNNNYNKATGKLTLTHTSSDKKFNALFSINYGKEKSNLIPFDLSMFTNLPPNAPALYDDEGKLNWENGTWLNPLSYLLRQFNTISDNLLANASLGYELLPGLTIKTNIGYTTTRRDEIATAPLKSYSPFSTTTDKTISSNFADTRRTVWIVEPQASWEKKIGASQLNVLAGATLQENLVEGERLRGTGFSSDAFVAQLTAANTITQVSGLYNQYKYHAGFARIGYDLKNKYLFNATARRDGSSRFGSNSQYANFGAIGAAWLFTNEDFLQKILPVVNFGKLRMSFGSTGNDQIEDYSYLESWGITATYEGRAGLYPLRIANPDYGWEITRKAEAGLEMEFLNSRFNISVGYYQNRSTNQLVSEPLPPSIGFNSMRANLPAVVQNSGWEIELFSKNYQKKKFSWTTSFNISFQKNKLVAFPGLESSIYVSSYIIGQPLDVLRQYNTSVDPVSGEYVFEDYDKSGDISDSDRYITTNINPIYFGGLDNTLIWKGWKLDILLQFVKQQGHGYLRTFDRPGFMQNQPVDVMNRWQKPGDITGVQKFSANVSWQPYLYASSYGNIRTVDASYLRIKNISLQYSLPDRWIKRIGMKQINLKAQALNLITFTSYKWSDPETQNTLRLPPLRMVNCGINIIL